MITHYTESLFTGPGNHVTGNELRHRELWFRAELHDYRISGASHI